jgi:predicted ATPase
LQFDLNTNLTKGILLSGPVGCGKTSLMNLMKYLTATEQKFFVKPCQDISFEFIQNGYEVIQNTARVNSTNPNPKQYALMIWEQKTT